MYVEYGCGLHGVDGWKNFDASMTLRYERLPIIGRLYTKNKTRFDSNVSYGDIIKGLDIKKNSCDGIYCSHVLEHLSLDELKKALINTRSYLKEGGIFRLVVPDLEFYINEYVNSKDKQSRAMKFMKDTYLGRVSTGSMASKLFARSYHLWMYDYEALKQELQIAGFSKIRRAEFNDSKDKEFIKAEDITRFKNALAIECIK